MFSLASSFHKTIHDFYFAIDHSALRRASHTSRSKIAAHHIDQHDKLKGFGKGNLKAKLAVVGRGQLSFSI